MFYGPNVHRFIHRQHTARQTTKPMKQNSAASIRMNCQTINALIQISFCSETNSIVANYLKHYLIRSHVRFWQDTEMS